MMSLLHQVCSTFLKTSVLLLVKRDYHHTNFGLVWIKGSKVMKGEGMAESASPQVENILNLPGKAKVTP